MLGLMGGIKMLVCGALSDDLYYYVLQHIDFYYRRMITLSLDIISIFMLVAIVRDEIGEITLH